MATLTDITPRLQQRLSARYASIDGHALRQGVEAAYTWLKTNHQIVNNLNVFPVPDGDTGTNMMLTMQAAWEEIQHQEDSSLGTVAKGVAHGALMGARGNSGVILSQLWRGFARAADDHMEMDVPDVVEALAEARDTAYKGVVRPVEGTILTVSKDVAKAAEDALASGVTSALELLERVVDAADVSVARTPDLLPILKQAGVVDSGGMGLYFILEGMLRSAYGMPLDQTEQSTRPLPSLELDAAQESIEPGQDWEVIVDFRPEGELDVQAFYRRLEAMGTSIQVGEGDGLYRMHIHVPDNTQYAPIDFVRQLGTITKVAIENLMDQVDSGPTESDGIEIHTENASPDSVAVVVVAPGTGIARVFTSLGAAAVVEGGQTMNPSTKQILSAIERLASEDIVILPNNKNIFMAATQAAELTVKNVAVVPSVSVPQGVSAMLRLDRQKDLETNIDLMTESLHDVQTGEITVATRSVEIEGVNAEEGQVIGLLEGELVVCGDELGPMLLALIGAADTSQSELITLYYGRDLSVQEANALADMVRNGWPDLEVELIDGGQPHYWFILSLE
jgi:DAK2 domain fusion protein YloV